MLHVNLCPWPGGKMACAQPPVTAGLGACSGDRASHPPGGLGLSSLPRLLPAPPPSTVL